MRAAVIVFPGSNCDRDMAVALKSAGADVDMVWHKDAALPDGVDLVAVPGGFSFGDYLRCGAIAAKSPICKALVQHVERGGYALGVCNGFQVLTETGLLPGALMRNAGLKFVCKTVDLRVETSDCAFTEGYKAGDIIALPVAHHDGNYTVDPDTLARLEQDARIPFRYLQNTNGSVADIAGVLSENRRVLGMMPHPERAVDAGHGGTDGQALFRGIVAQLATA
ncbi:phosphoribosylformylglycinamidine synthase subunit PurQ [Yoonia sediminilitoris]|uniref:Phosphoribosylformylglycinamidine synthase subunit PurQ n=1 Tax=Yoonia sediminilitoris TaxID=1286148 RepID=A0A2T6K9A1_9RHOB|nr:phosphoribosylformylglycinamidine synthase subunit PurQ [Yoonia sediminilitoris]PUB11286.1 phosphoribosylformylglycinamidine synthase subunit I [Yoonia sediminilitoris]RCW91102.1 phosphoribosylformylglycinamidine synthase subunit I [Yoonia sediminilitoris]